MYIVVETVSWIVFMRKYPDGYHRWVLALQLWRRSVNLRRAVADYIDQTQVNTMLDDVL